MCLLAVQNFLSAAVGIVVVVALVRGIVRTTTDRLGNFWVDLTRASFRILLPIATVAAIALVIGGVVQNFWSTEVTNTATGASQLIPGGPVASRKRSRSWVPTVAGTSTPTLPIPLKTRASSPACSKCSSSS